MNKGETWRLLDDEPRDAGENMAVDEALALSMAGGGALPVLRFYRWSSPALTYGYFQNPGQEIDINYCKSNNISFSRRMTGGGVVLHFGDLTYSVITDIGFFGVRNDVMSTYEILHRSVKNALGFLGITAELCVLNPGGTDRRRGFCFAKHSRYDLLVNDIKIAGSAQRRLSNILVHQGYIMLYEAPKESAEILKGGKDNRCACGIDMPSGFPPREKIASSMARSFEDEFDLKFERGYLSAAERKEAEQLNFDKYSSDKWKYLH